MNMNPVEIARQQAARSEGGNFTRSTYFALADGETKHLRFLTANEPMKVISHACGAHLVDIPASVWDATIAAGQQVACPQCGQPLTDADVQYERPMIQGAFMHRFVQTSDPNKKGNFVCLESRDNANMGLVPAGPDGSPLYSCPICSSPANLNDKGKPKKPSYRLFAVAVEREVEQVIETVNGIPTPVIKGTKDVMVTEEDGTTHPKVVLVDMGWKSFFEKVFSRFQDKSQSIAYYDWRVTRAGTSLDTTYQVDPINIENPTTVDMRDYEQWMPHPEESLQRTGSPDYYVQNGWIVAGFTPQQQEETPLQAASNMVAQAANFVPQQAMPQAGAIPWDAVQGQVAGQ